jgi:hypothetical protein
MINNSTNNPTNKHLSPQTIGTEKDSKPSSSDKRFSNDNTDINKL